MMTNNDDPISVETVMMKMTMKWSNENDIDINY